MDAKRIAAEKATAYIDHEMVVGLGTGSTAYWAIQKIGENVKRGLRIQAVATSIQSENLAKALGIPMLSMSMVDSIDLTIDGADEVDEAWNLIKGGGGALLREKIVASTSKNLFIVVDERKLVKKLGAFPLPVEIVTFAHEITQNKLRALGCIPVLRMKEQHPYLTDNGNYIVDCDFGSIDHPEELHQIINMIPGVVDNGLFIKMAAKVIVGYQDGTVIEM
ncbi:ribose-5-phosphate isomerase RpiA [Paenibacillus hexagrammi]|uniref:Ribose-5-phosphate isomerase A n=1 Tax=Paenibacillus hexagrammi TaxID=2908839 RepID=A0ABY3SN49_9BACL|nr:ribose-5-phosphate isomerase RpiA [Paenibacillus sp. YPD9-1]UJF35468.1 ribose-5-phosphate isomerase RpiA [Paenibacillus sp. YPD9-1]